MTQNELDVALATNPELNLCGMDLRNLTFKGRDVSRVRFCNSDLRGVDFDGAILGDPKAQTSTGPIIGKLGGEFYPIRSVTNDDSMTISTRFAGADLRGAKLTNLRATAAGSTWKPFEFLDGKRADGTRPTPKEISEHRNHPLADLRTHLATCKTDDSTVLLDEAHAKRVQRQTYDERRKEMEEESRQALADKAKNAYRPVANFRKPQTREIEGQTYQTPTYLRQF